MKILQQIVMYFIFGIVAILLGIACMHIFLEPNDKTTEGLAYFLYLFESILIIEIGIRIGVLIIMLFILLDLFYLKKKLKNNRKGIIIRLGILLFITVFLTSMYYILEKVINVI